MDGLCRRVNKYSKHLICVDPLQLCMRTKYEKVLWHKERQFRITGSRCYGIYTYGKINSSKINWDEKSRKYFWPKKFKPTTALEHGLKCESAARDAYKLQKNVDVIETGLIICKKNPWLAYSPDGIVSQNNIPMKLLEIKCIAAGITNTIEEAIKTIKYVTVVNNEYQLKKKHLYYQQIQLGMAILNLASTNFIIYCSADKRFVTINVPVDHQFLKYLLYTLKFKY